MHRAPSSRGFTLVEIIVSLGIFSVVAVVALGALTKVIGSNKRAQSIQSAVTNVNFALEAMTREMRVGSTFYCSTTGGSSVIVPVTSRQACASGDGTLIAFNSTTKDTSTGSNYTYAYRFVLGSDGTYSLEKGESSVGSIGSSSFVPVLDPSVVIEKYTLYVSSDAYPLIFIRLSGYSGVREKDRSYFDVQTSISPRIP